jgi:hypothetical protein
VRIVVCTGETRRPGIAESDPEPGRSRRSIMPTVTDANLTLTESDQRVTVRVTANVTFSSFERQLAGLGMDWHPHVTLHDFDGAATDPGAQIFEFLRPGDERLADFAVTVGSGSQVLPLVQEKVFDRDELKVDAANNDDEIKAKIRIHTNDAQVENTPDVLTEQKILAD